MRIDFLSVPRHRGTVLLKTGENEKNHISGVCWPILTFQGSNWGFLRSGKRLEGFSRSQNHSETKNNTSRSKNDYFLRGFFKSKPRQLKLIFFQIFLLILFSYRVYSIFLLRPIEIMIFSLFDTPYHVYTFWQSPNSSRAIVR